MQPFVPHTGFYVPSVADLCSIPKPEHARADWGYCGIAALSAGTGKPPLDILALIPGWPGYTPSAMIVATLKVLGYSPKRLLVHKHLQRSWPQLTPSLPAHVALGRLYLGSGRFAGSHWICFRWQPPALLPFLYDNLLGLDTWVQTSEVLFFYHADALLKSLYFLSR